MEFYDWQRTFSFSKARWVIVVSARRYGKTYGLRWQCIRDYLKRERRFVEVVRHKNEVGVIGPKYFDKVKSDKLFPDLDFKYEHNTFYMRRGEEEPWEVIGYLLALTDETVIKKITFANVKRIIFDEGFIENKDRYKRYLPREFERLSGLRMSVTNETPANPSDSVVYILGNAVDYTCPLLEPLGIDKIPSYGRHIYSDGDVLFDFVEPVYYEEFAKNTASGRALAGSDEGAKLLANEFTAAHDGFVEKRPKGAKFWQGFVFLGHTFGLWLSDSAYCHVCEKVPKDARLKAFTLDDDRINFDFIRKSGNDALVLRKLFYEKLLRYETPLIRERFIEMLTVLNIV